MAKRDYDKLKTNAKAFKQESRERTVESWKKADKKQRNQSISTGISSVGKLFLFLLIFISLIAILRAEEIPTFQGLLQTLSTAPSIPLDIFRVDLSGSGFLLFEWLGKAINAITFILTACLNVIVMVVWFLRYLFA